MNRKSLLIRLVPATFLMGAAFGVVVGQLGAAIKGSAVFRDVPTTSFADDAIGEMYELGIIKGLDSEHFGPDMPLTRAQAAVLFQRLRNNIEGITPANSSSSRSSSRSSSSSSAVSSSSSSTSSASSSLTYNPGGYVHFDSNAYNIDKNASIGAVTVIIVRTGGNQGAGTVDYSFSGGTAVPGKNYQPISGKLTFGSKETSKKVTLQIMNDTTTSGTKTVNLVLKNPTGAVGISAPSNIYLNINDPNAPSSSGTSTSSSSSAAATSTTIGFGAAAYGVDEKGGSLTVTVVRSGVTSTSAGVSYTTTDSTAKSGIDYSATSGSFTFAAGETTKTFTVSISNNASIEGNRMFFVNLNNPTGGASLSSGAAAVTINDDESVTYGSGSLRFSSSTYSVSKSQSFVTITVNHILGVGPVSVNYATNGGSATSGIDYTPANGTLNFAANETSKTFTVPIINNPNSTGGKTINLTLNSPSGNVPLSDPSTAVVTINM